MDSDKIDDAVDKANEVLGGLLENACGWLVEKIEAARERRENAEEEKEDRRPVHPLEEKQLKSHSSSKEKLQHAG